MLRCGDKGETPGGICMGGGGGSSVFERVKSCSGLPRLLGLLGRPVQAANLPPFMCFSIYYVIMISPLITTRIWYGSLQT